MSKLMRIFYYKLAGRGYSFATCLEGALKVKELTYMHSEGRAEFTDLLGRNDTKLNYILIHHTTPHHQQVCKL